MFNFFRDLFRPKQKEQVPASSAVETAPIVEEEGQPVDQRQISYSPPQLIFASAQSVGKQRDHNEDTLYTMQATFADGSRDLPFGIFLIADGMGGHLNGEIASGAAVKALSEYLITRFYIPFLSGQNDSERESVHEVMEHGVMEAHHAVQLNAPGGGTTLTAAIVVGDQITLAHVGDSRAYFIDSERPIQVMTQDHSLVRRLQDLGQIDEKEASIHPQRNVLYRALGQSETFRPDINTHILPQSGYLLLCSDGLWGSVSDEDIYRIVHAAANPVTACRALVDAANQAGGPDNISAVLVKYLS